jgi:hypothetical protein
LLGLVWRLLVHVWVRTTRRKAYQDDCQEYDYAPF